MSHKEGRTCQTVVNGDETEAGSVRAAVQASIRGNESEPRAFDRFGMSVGGPRDSVDADKAGAFRRCRWGRGVFLGRFSIRHGRRGNVVIDRVRAARPFRFGIR